MTLMKLFVYLLLMILILGNSTLYAVAMPEFYQNNFAQNEHSQDSYGVRYGQNRYIQKDVYMFPDDVINSNRQGCDNNQPVRRLPSKSYPSSNNVSRNVVYVSDLYPKRKVIDSSYYYDPMAAKSMQYPQLNRKTSRYLYASDFEPKKYSRTFQNMPYRNSLNNHQLLSEKASVRYVPVPVYIYNKDSLSSQPGFNIHNPGLESYTKINQYSLNNTDFHNELKNPLAINPLTIHSLESSPGNFSTSINDHLLDQYTSFSSNQMLYNSSDFLRSNHSELDYLPEFIDY